MLKNYWKYIKKELAELGAKKWITFIKPCFSFFPEERPKFAKLWEKIEEEINYNILKEGKIKIKRIIKFEEL